ncbi:dipicolinate synthase subunit DpsA [Paenibacillus melissococcoides]|uniref:Dipicolinate synthase subunit DpsA n=1 Tax=Paenibacillus melissococcoides TaxID=2912268 RepID=A0ABN8U2N2_9BACL|nr:MULTISPECIES: dipicolinate synthase subunit DpsA [Paenibacillus]MEB9892525.1 dipicolinate synthase subunit DpsA [Bacillus cereus]CAH8243830.1 dipicolinate synthase subunit DpsA [Paenibacillus melissococcoides]CAH8704468.1 dipicolinate synthase subunit DpsA [Paenibacillus melissococcoides]CAH8707242.1 dipicolinate synthase subunit DpsA [Paenibacillus melissococcoides]GIO77325.1 dipicolinate synthase subunit A [Paenibacillus dendritiformis]
MLTGVQVVFIGGDARQLEIIQKLSELDASVILVGYEQLQNPFHGVQRQPLTPELLRKADAVVLPAVGTDDKGKVHAIFTSEELVLAEEHVAALPEHAVLFTGMAKPYLSKLCTKYRLKLFELFDRDDVAIYNSIPTAEGALMMAIQHTDITLHGSESVVLGMGRTGFTMARTLLGVGARVRIGVRRNEHFARATEMGFNPFYIRDLAREVSNIDLLFNTIPTMIVTAQVIAQIPHRAVIIDLASMPGGVDFRFAEKRGIKAMLAPGLPGIVAPKTAGRILAQSISQLLQESMVERGIIGQ